MKLHVIGDSITYLVAKHGGVAMFAEHGIDATLDGSPGKRADDLLRQQAWRAACDTAPDVLVYALGANDLMGETFKDPDDPPFSKTELAALTGCLMGQLVYGGHFAEHTLWVDVTTRTLNGHYNAGARKVNGEMSELCPHFDYGYVEWDECHAPTSDLIHQKLAGSKMWVDAVVAAIT